MNQKEVNAVYILLYPNDKLRLLVAGNGDQGLYSLSILKNIFGLFLQVLYI